MEALWKFASYAVILARMVSAQLVYVGCYKDTSVRALSGARFSSNTLTNENCIDFCKTRTFLYAATQNSNTCFCDDEYDMHGVSTGCTKACTGNSAQICGGAWANAVYKTGRMDPNWWRVGGGERLQLHVIETRSARKRMLCEVACDQMEQCRSFNYRAGDGTCELNDAGATATSDVSQEEGWDWYHNN